MGTLLSTGDVFEPGYTDVVEHLLQRAHCGLSSLHYLVLTFSSSETAKHDKFAVPCLLNHPIDKLILR